MARHGVPQRLLTDNGTALNPIRRGWVGELTALMRSLAVQAISSSVAHPQTQGKNERGHSTLARWLAARPATHAKAAPGTYIGNGKPRGFLATQQTAKAETPTWSATS